jgi:hypothetical protein
MVVTNLTPRPSLIVSINLVRNTITVLYTIEKLQKRSYPLFLSGDIQKLEVLFHEDFSDAQTN